MRKIKFKNITGERYDSIAEVFNVAECREVIKGWQDCNHTERERFGAGDQKVGFEESKKDLLFGTTRFDESFKKVKKDIDREAADYFKMARVNRSRPDVVGGSVNVARALVGHPRAMRRRVADRRPKKVVEICYAISCPWYITPEERLRYGCAVLACAEALEGAGYGVAITLFADMTTDYSHKAITLLEIPIKQFATPFNLTKLQFPVAAESSLFHLGRYWAHRFSDGFWSSGEGFAADTDSIDRADEIVEYCDSKGAVFLSHTMMHDKLGKGNVGKTFEHIEGEIARLSKL